MRQRDEGSTQFEVADICLAPSVRSCSGVGVVQTTTLSGSYVPCLRWARCISISSFTVRVHTFIIAIDSATHASYGSYWTRNPPLSTRRNRLPRRRSPACHHESFSSIPLTRPPACRPKRALRKSRTDGSVSWSGSFYKREENC